MRIFCITLLFAPLFALGQNPFPNDWVGNWTGKLDIFSAAGKVNEVDMLLEIHPLDTSATGRYSWGMTYGSKAQDWRPYELVPVQPDKGLWLVDEKNGIAMESWLINGRLLCWFVVSGNRILFMYEKTGPDTMLVEVISGKESVFSTTQNRPDDAEPNVYEVQTYPFSIFQRAILQRKP